VGQDFQEVHASYDYSGFKMRMRPKISPRPLILIALLLPVLLLAGGIVAFAQSRGNILGGDFWKEQALRTVIPFWSHHGTDSIHGGFLTNLDRKGEKIGGSEKYPSMISRHVFSYSVAYLLTGEKRYIETASQGVAFLLAHGWDSTYGGWFDELDEMGNPLRTTKDGFVQAYATTGLTMYYFVTHDSTVLSYIERSNDILQDRSRDTAWGGYYKTLGRELNVEVSDKDFTAQIAPVSGYLLYLYLATREEKYLRQIREIVEIVQKRMLDRESEWILDSYDRNWGKAGEGDVNVGHNIEMSWVCLRLFALTQDGALREQAERLAAKLNRWGSDTVTGLWYWRLKKEDPSQHSDDAAWWIQAYGNMFQLCLYHLRGERSYIDNFIKGAGAWNRYFIDNEFGDTFLSIYTDGRIKDATKGNRYKASYHTMEHSLLNLLYLDLWLNKINVRLHFFIHSPGKNSRLYPVPVEDPSVRIIDVEVNGTSWQNFDSQKGWIDLPVIPNEAMVTVTLGG